MQYAHNRILSQKCSKIRLCSHALSRPYSLTRKGKPPHDVFPLEYQRSALCLLVSAVHHVLALCALWSSSIRTWSTHPSSKCLHRFSASCAFVLHTVHSSLSTTFFVVFAFLWKTGFVCPPYPDCLRSYRRFPCATEEA